MTKLRIRLYLCLAAVLWTAAPARAQFQPRPIDTAPDAESYHIEGSVGIWFPSTDMTVTSAGSGALKGLAGTSINAENDLGLPSSERFPEFQLTLRPARSHKLRMQLIPIQSTGSATVTRDIVFNGQRYRFGTPVNSTLDWKAWRFNYEYDFITKARGYGGFIVEAKYTDVRVDLAAPVLGLAEFAQARAPIPALGGVVCVYVVPSVSISGEVTAFKLPTVENKYAGHYVDLDIYSTYNFNRYIGARGGYRMLDLGYLVNQDTGSFTLNGLYFAAVVRY